MHVQDPLLKGQNRRWARQARRYGQHLLGFPGKLREACGGKRAFPDFTSNGSQGKAPTEASPEFEARVKAHNLTSKEVEEVFQLPVRLVLLGWSGDPRAVPFLHQALSSPNPMIQIVAATGLAEIGDKSSIPWIIDACRKSPAHAEAIAQALVYFDDNAAQNAVDQFIPKDRAKAFRDAKTHGQVKPLSSPLYDKLPNQ